MEFTSKVRGAEYCPECGEKIRWIQLITGMWIAVQERPIMYIPGEGKMWLVEYRRRDAIILKDCLIYKAFRGMDRSKIVYGYEPHVFNCIDKRKGGAKVHGSP